MVDGMELTVNSTDLSGLAQWIIVVILYRTLVHDSRSPDSAVRGLGETVNVSTGDFAGISLDASEGVQP
jgi:hypothetical protein